MINFYLNGSAETYYNNLPENVKTDYSALKQALENRVQSKDLDYNLISIKQTKRNHQQLELLLILDCMYIWG